MSALLLLLSIIVIKPRFGLQKANFGIYGTKYKLDPIPVAQPTESKYKYTAVATLTYAILRSLWQCICRQLCNVRSTVKYLTKTFVFTSTWVKLSDYQEC